MFLLKLIFLIFTALCGSTGELLGPPEGNNNNNNNVKGLYRRHYTAPTIGRGFQSIYRRNDHHQNARSVPRSGDKPSTATRSRSGTPGKSSRPEQPKPQPAPTKPGQGSPPVPPPPGVQAVPPRGQTAPNGAAPRSLRRR